MKCKQCNTELIGRKQYCNDACRMAFNRTQPEQSEQPEHAQPEHLQPEHKPEHASLEHYLANPDRYARRTNPNTLNWGEPMNVNELKQAGYKANRVTIPGDHDYVNRPPKAVVRRVARAIQGAIDRHS